MKKILLTTLTASFLFLSGSLFASAQYYDQSQYQYANQYTNYQNQNYVYSNYGNNSQNITNCYYTGTNPRTYYGDCRGMIREQNYTYQTNYAPVYTYQNQYPTNGYYQNNYNNNVGQYYTYGYANGSWHPGYSTNNISNMFNGLFQNVNQGISQSANCYYQNGYQICY